MSQETASSLVLSDIEYRPSNPVCNCSELDWCPQRRLDEDQARHLIERILDGTWANLVLPSGHTLARYLDGFGLEIAVRQRTPENSESPT